MKLVNMVSPCYISNAYGNALCDKTLEDIATAFLGIDAEFIGVLETGLNDGNSGRIRMDTDPLRNVQQDQALISDIKAQVGDIINGKHRVHKHYFRQRRMLLIWRRASLALLYMLSHDDPGSRQLVATDTIVRNIERLATPLNDLLPAAAVKGVLDREDRAIIRLRMLLLDVMLDIYHERMSSTRTLKTW